MSSDKLKGKDKNDQGKEDASGSGGMTVENLRKYLATKLGFSDDYEKERTIPDKVLNDVSFDGIVDYMKSDKCKNIITMAGAGISTSAGIPDFRSPVSGLYHNLQKYKLPHPQAIFELDFFYDNPRPFFELAKELYPGTFRPTICHYFVKLLHDKGLLVRHYTQNIDTLERVAGMPSEKLVEAHGTFNQGHCLECRKEYSQQWMKEKIFSDDIPPICDDCPGVVKPDIVFFGENLPENFHRNICIDFPQCDLLIIMGSSLAVQPFASLIDRVSDGCPRLLINREKAGERTGLMTLMGMSGGMEFDSDDNIRDVAWLGDCDEGCLILAEKLGWGDELKNLFESESKRIDSETKKTKQQVQVKSCTDNHEKIEGTSKDQGSEEKCKTKPEDSEKQTEQKEKSPENKL